MKKIVFFDIDGTLLDHDKNLPAAAKEAVKTLQDNGIYTAIATGRAPFMITELLEELNISSYVCYNGQYVVFEGSVIYTNPILTSELEKLTEAATPKNHHLVYMTDKTMKANVKHDERIENAVGSLKLAHPEYDPQYYKKHEIYQSLFFVREHEDEYLKDFEHISFIRWHEESVDVVPKGGSKAEGIKKMIERLGFDMENVYAFGDGLNDVEMLQTVGTGVAMGNALDVVKMYADYVTTDVDDNGIVNGLRAIGLLDASFETIK